MVNQIEYFRLVQKFIIKFVMAEKCKLWEIYQRMYMEKDVLVQNVYK